ncbi:hypothetical protein [Alcaligenes faecalis]|uniref:hypothetical protein n=1 Tax=Alcaligenes faecalis TaxID=511 RepID=UPI0034D75378
MNNVYQQLIQKERSRIEALQRRIARHKQRIETIEELAAEDDCDVEGGSPLSRVEEAAAKPTARHEGQLSVDNGQKSASLVGSSEAQPRFPSRVNAKTLRLLAFLGEDAAGKTLDELVEYSDSACLGMTRKDITSFANVYRTRFDLLMSPAVGFYRLTESGQKFISERLAPSERSVLTVEALLPHSHNDDEL